MPRSYDVSGLSTRALTIGLLIIFAIPIGYLSWVFWTAGEWRATYPQCVNFKECSEDVLEIHNSLTKEQMTELNEEYSYMTLHMNGKGECYDGKGVCNQRLVDFYAKIDKRE
jgi:hypothetical protein